MEELFQILFEFLIDMGLDLASDKGKNIFLRILEFLLIGIIYGGVFAAVFCVALHVMNSSVAGGWMIILLDLFLLGCVVYAIRKRKRIGNYEGEEE